VSAALRQLGQVSPVAAIDEAENLLAIEGRNACPGAGSCGGMFTANTNEFGLRAPWA